MGAKIGGFSGFAARRPQHFNDSPFGRIESQTGSELAADVQQPAPFFPLTG
jgi:hypothetical protein